MKKAIVTITLGEKYEKLFAENCKVSWQQYCHKFDYDLIEIRENIDKSDRAQTRSPSWQKLLVLSQKWSFQYDRIVWVDADIIINNTFAYDICTGVPIEKVGAVDSYSIPTREIHDIALARLYKKWGEENVKFLNNLKPNSYYTNRGLPGDTLNEVMQAGVFVCSPKYHREIFELIYNKYEDSHGAEGNYEMPAMSYELIKANLVHWISPRFNFVVGKVLAAFYPEFNLEEKSFWIKLFYKVTGSGKKIRNEIELLYLKNIYDLSIFMHFAGSINTMTKMKQLLQQ